VIIQILNFLVVRPMLLFLRINVLSYIPNHKVLYLLGMVMELRDTNYGILILTKSPLT
jgi:hypothetical protein